MSRGARSKLGRLVELTVQGSERPIRRALARHLGEASKVNATIDRLNKERRREMTED
jgi:tRNA U55 pseudouridine synthase TruB